MTNKSHLEVNIALKEAYLKNARKMGAIAAYGKITTEPQFLFDDSLDTFREFLAPYKMTPQGYFAGNMLFNLIRAVELYFTEIVKIMLTTYPKKIGSTQFKLSEIVDKPKEEIVLLAAERYLNDLTYKKPLDYLSELCEILSIDAEKLKPLWPGFIEAKARRDLGLHNDWIVNDTYLRKVREAGLEPTQTPNSMICPDHEYMQRAYDHCNDLIKSISRLVEEKFETKTADA